MGFEFNPTVEDNDALSEEVSYSNNDGRFIRSKKDNLLLKDLQINPNDLFKYVDPDATYWGDFDGIPFKCASSVEEDYIIVTLTPEKLNEELTNEVEDRLTFKGALEYKNKTEFKGRTKGDKIGSGSILYDKNLAREVAGLSQFTMQDFIITPSKRLKYEKGVDIDGKHFNNSLDVCKYYIDKWIEACLIQTQLKKVRPVMGSGETHRHKVLVPHQYKSDRNDTQRPLLLSEARQHMIDTYDTVIAPEGLEADEVVDAVAARAYDYARATGTRIRVVKGANDKDARSKRGVLHDWNKSFHFDNPQCWLIKDFDEDVGKIEIHKGHIKAAGALSLAYQLLMGDSADEYNPRKYLPDEYKDATQGYGDEAFYKDFAPLTNSTDIFQKLVDKYYEWFPYGLEYTAWDGTEISEDTASYLQKHYHLAYMLEGKDDNSTIFTLLDKFGVNYGKILSNNKLSAPKPVFLPSEQAEIKLAELSASLSEISGGIKNYSALKKGDLVEMIKGIKQDIDNVLPKFDEFYEMKQEEK